MENNKNELSEMARLVDQRVSDLRGVKSQLDIANAAGYTNQNMITMLKQGKAKVSIDRAHKLAIALEVDPRKFMIAALRQFYSREVVDQMLKDLGAKTA